MGSEDNRSLNINISAGTIIKTVVVLALFWFLYIMRDLALVILTALVIASAIEPFIAWLGKYKVNRTLAVIIIYLLIAFALAGIFYFFVPSLIADLSDFFSNLPSYFESLSVWNPFNSGVTSTEDLGLVGTLSPANIAEQLNTFFSATSKGFVQAVSTLFGGILSLVLIIVLSFYLAVQEDGVAKFLKIVIPARYENYLLGLWRRSQTKIGKWLQGQLLLGVLMGVLVYLGLTIFGVRNALLLALLAAIFEIIPVFGPILSAIPAVIFGFVDGGVTKGLLVVGLYLIIQQFENHLIYPLVVKKIVGVPPILVILAVIIGLKLAGVLGVILAIPASSVLMELLDDVQKDKTAHASRA